MVQKTTNAPISTHTEYAHALTTCRECGSRVPAERARSGRCGECRGAG